MGFVSRLTDKSQRLLIQEIVGLLANSSFENIVRLTYLAEKLSRNEWDRGVVQKMRKHFQDRHPSALLAKDVLENLSRNCRNKRINNLMINNLLIGNHYREYEFKEKEGFVPPMSLVISPSMRCNLNCYGCYAGDYQKDFGLSTELVERILQEAKDLGIFFITISGGEPFIRTDLLDLFAKHDDMYFQVYTNGTLIDAGMAKRLESLGNVAPLISVEGYKKETDERRGEGVFEKVMNAFECLDREGVPFGASITETRQNIDLISSEEFIDFLLSKKVRIIWYFQYIPVGRKPDMELMPTPEQRDALRRRVQAIRTTKPVFVGDFWNDGPYVHGCIAGARYYLHINSRGDIEPCVFCHYAVDNIEKTTLKEALNSRFFKNIRVRQPYRDNHLTPCMLIDAPWVLREVLEKSPGVYPTCEGAEKLVTELAPELDVYARQYNEIADKAWAEEWKGAAIITPRGEARGEGRFAPRGLTKEEDKEYAYEE